MRITVTELNPTDITSGLPDGTYQLLWGSLYRVATEHGFWASDSNSHTETREVCDKEPEKMLQRALLSLGLAVLHGNLVTLGLDPDARPLVGIWTDPQTNIVYFDKPRHFFDKGEALAFARKHNQVSIYDCAAGCCVPAGGTGERVSDEEAA